MKKNLLLLAVALLPLAASAQLPKWEWHPKYMGTLHAGYSTSSKVEGYKTYTAKALLGTLQGVQLSNYLSAAIGVDGQMFTHYYKGGKLRWSLTSYANFRGCVPLQGSFTPYLNLSLGAVTQLKPSHGSEFYCEFGPGFRYKKLDFNCGLVHQPMPKQEKGTNHFYAKIGFYF